jgi:hypothetical protein
METTTAKRITFTKVTEQHDYVDARFDVLLDGVKIGQVTRNVESCDLDRGTTRMLARMSAPSTRWEAEVRYAATRSTRVDAVIDLLMEQGMDYREAREVAGKRGL